jgi:biotin carboxylase
MKKILVLCPNVWDKEALSRREIRDRYDLVFAGEELLETPSLWKGIRFDLFRYMRALIDRFEADGLAGVVGTGDYPGSMMAAFVGKELGFPVPDPKAVTLLSHKYYSREIQRVATPEATPEFFTIDPFAPFQSNGRPRLAYPFFVKPVKGTMSIRARMVNEDRELRAAVKTSLKERFVLTMLLRPFQQLLDAYADRRVPAHHFIAEAPLCGDQVTVDGFVQGGKAQIMGIVDSIMYPGTMSFERFEYPSRHPPAVQDRMREIAARAIESSGFDHSCFNIELFYDRARERISIIEINPRMSYQFGDLYERVDGTNTYDVQLGLALGDPVEWSSGRGRDRVAASFVLRRFEDGRCVRAPSSAEITRIQEAFPGTTIKILARVGKRLSEQDQDVGSYRYAIINMGAKDREALEDAFREAKCMLAFEFG